MYKLKKFLAMVRSGQEHGKLIFRRGDFFHEVAEEVNLTVESFRENAKEGLEEVNELLEFTSKVLRVVAPEDKRPVLEEIHQKIDSLKVH